MSFSNISLHTPKHLATMRTLLSVMDNISVDYLNEIGAKSGFDNDTVVTIQHSQISLTIDDGEECFVVSVDFIDKDGDTNGVAFIFADSSGGVSLDYPY